MLVATRFTESESYMAISKFGFSYLPDEWSEADDKAVEDALYALREIRDRKKVGKLETWSQYDDYLSFAIRLRGQAKIISAKKGLDLGKVWNTIKKQMLQKIKGNVIDGMFEISDHYRTEIRKIWALAEFESPYDRKRQKEIAQVLVMDKSEKTQDAFKAQSATQEMLFERDDYLSEKDRTGLNLEETLEDKSSHGTDPQETYDQGDIATYLLEQANITDRQRVIAEHVLDLNEEVNYTKLGRIVGCSRQTVEREIKALAPHIKDWMKREGREGEGRSQNKT